MNVNRVTLSVFGTTGVLLAASLTMLAMVSALVTFDAWPTRSGGAVASDVAIQRGPAVSVVRAVRHARPSSGAAAADRSAAASGAGSAQAGTGGAAAGASGGVVGSGSGGSTRPGTSGPSPYVPQTPSGGPEPIPTPQPEPQPTPDPVHDVVNDATSTVCGATSVGC
jgi:hypothetical protein